MLGTTSPVSDFSVNVASWSLMELAFAAMTMYCEEAPVEEILMQPWLVAPLTTVA